MWWRCAPRDDVFCENAVFVSRERGKRGPSRFPFGPDERKLTKFVTRLWRAEYEERKTITGSRGSRMAEYRLIRPSFESRIIRFAVRAIRTTDRSFFFVCVYSERLPDRVHIYMCIYITVAPDTLRPCSEIGRSSGKKTLSAFEDRSRPVSDCGGFAAVAEPRSLGS